MQIAEVEKDRRCCCRRRRGWGLWYSSEVASHFCHAREALLLSTPLQRLILQLLTLDCDLGTMFGWLFPWSLYLFGLVTKTSMDLTGGSGSRMLHKGESFSASTESFGLLFTFFRLAHTCLYKPSCDSACQNVILTNKVSKCQVSSYAIGFSTSFRKAEKFDWMKIINEKSDTASCKVRYDRLELFKRFIYLFKIRIICLELEAHFAPSDVRKGKSS